MSLRTSINPIGLRAAGKHRAQRTGRNAALIRRLTAGVASLALLLSGLGVAAPAVRAVSGVSCGDKIQSVCNVALNELDSLVTSTEQCVFGNQVAPCQAVKASAQEAYAIATQLASDCISAYPQNSACATVQQELRDAEAGLANCVNLTPGTLCASYVNFALATAQSIESILISTAFGCWQRQTQICQTLGAEADAATQGIENCVSMSPGTLCPAVIALLEQELAAIETTVSDSTYVGTLPGSDNPSDLVVDPVQYAAKVTDMEQKSAVVDEDLALFATQPVPDDSSVPPPPPCCSAGVPPSAKVAVIGYPQGNHNWCVPASTATTLSAFGVSSSVSGLATEEDSSEKTGTFMGKAAPALRRRVPYYYVYDFSSGARDLMHKVSYDIGEHSAPVIVGAYTEGLYWWSVAETQGHHALTAYLYHTSSGGGFSVYDSAFDKRKQISLAELSAANQADYDDQLVW